MPARAALTGLVAVLFALLLGAAHLSYVAGYGVARPSLPIWQYPGADLSQAVLGAEAFLRDRAWHLPLAATDRLLSDGEPVSIVYTDSTPWIAIAAKAAGLDTNSVNVIGLAVCLNFLLQPLAVVALLLAAGVRRAEVLILGAVLGSLLPAWYFRTSVHIALSSQWLIALALALAVWAIRFGVSWAVVGGLCALGAFAIGIHAYLFVMVAAVAVGGLLADLARTGWRALPRTAMGLGLFAAASAASAWLLGYGVGGGADGFGVYTMNLLSPFVPQISGIRELLTGNPGRIIDATGGQYEGYSYLGAGVFLTLVLAAVARALAGSAKLSSARRRAAIPLLLALAALTLLAVSNHVFAGPVQVLSVAVPGQAILNSVRGSGRLFWPVPYALLALALVALDRVPRRGLAALALILAVALQILDTATLRRSIQQAYAAPPAPPSPALDPWRHGPLAGHDLRLLPRFLCEAPADAELVRELSLVVLRSGGRIEGGPMARRRPDACADDRSAAALQTAGSWVEVLLQRSLPPATLAVAARSRQCVPLAFGVACGTAVPSTLGSAAPLPILAPLADGERVELTAAGAGRRLEGPGWSDPESFGTWTDGKRAFLMLPLGPDWNGVTVTVEAHSYAPRSESGQAVTVLVGNQPLARWDVSAQRNGRFAVTVPRGLWTGSTVLMELDTPEALSPHAAEGSPDSRTLGIAVHAISVHAGAP